MNRPKTILIIEDQKNMSDTYKLQLETNGYKILQAFTSQEALEILKKSQPDLIILDLVMPDIQGLDLLGEIKKMPDCGTIPVVVTTALLSPEKQAEAKKLGVKEYLIKTQSLPSEVSRVVKKILQ